MKTLSFQQGSPEWLAHRRTTRNASDAPAMMGASPYVTRAELLRRVATGIERDVDNATQARFDRGHEVEPALRALAEAMIGEELYPVTCVSDDGYLGSSFDGVTLDEETILEAKQSNAAKVALMDQGTIPPVDYWQIVQQFAVCATAERCYYLVGDGTEDGTRWMVIERSQVEADIPKLLAGWQQFDADVAAYVPEPEAAPAPAGRAPDQLPSLSIQVTGMVTASNLADFKAQALAVLGGINRDLQTDEDFANAEKTVKWCKGVEERLEATKQQVLGQTADIDAVFRTMDEVSAETRRIRLELDKLVAKEKENRRLEIVTRGRDAYAAHVEALKAETKGVWLQLAAPDFAGAIKGKKSLSSMKDAVDTVLAQAKIAANESAAHIRAALALLTEETAEHKHLFPDYLTFIGKPLDDIRALVRGRIAEHKQREEEKLAQERERIRAEEAERMEREQAADRSRRASAVIDEYKRAMLGCVVLSVEEIRARIDVMSANPPPADIADAVRDDYQRALEGMRDCLDKAEQEMEAAKAKQQDTTPAAEVSEPEPTPAPIAPVAADRPGARIKLGDINARLAPLSITADGLASLGFKPVGKEGAAKLYAEADFSRICQALTDLIRQAAEASTSRKAA